MNPPASPAQAVPYGTMPARAVPYGTLPARAVPYGTMPQPGSALTRRGALLAGLGAIGALTVGCDPAGPEEPAPAPPVPSPTEPPLPPLAGASAAADREAELGGQSASLLKSGGDDLSGAVRAILTAIGAGHRAHQVALAGAQPTGRPTGGQDPPPTPKPTKIAVPAGLQRLIAAEADAAAEHAGRTGRTEGTTALFWASLAASADGYAQALRQQGGAAKGAAPAKAPKAGAHRPVEPVDPTAATRAMVEQLYAVGYGYQVAIGHLDDDRFERASTALRGHRSLRDRLIAGLLEESGEVPAAAPAYDVPVRPKDAASAVKLIMTLETALLPFCGQWVAAATDDEDREAAVATLRSITVASVSWGGPLLAWPGYVEQ